jgi:hypothetical protein
MIERLRSSTPKKSNVGWWNQLIQFKNKIKKIPLENLKKK